MKNKQRRTMHKKAELTEIEKRIYLKTSKRSLLDQEVDPLYLIQEARKILEQYPEHKLSASAEEIDQTVHNIRRSSTVQDNHILFILVGVLYPAEPTFEFKAFGGKKFKVIFGQKSLSLRNYFAEARAFLNQEGLPFANYLYDLLQAYLRSFILDENEQIIEPTRLHQAGREMPQISYNKSRQTLNLKLSNHDYLSNPQNVRDLLLLVQKKRESFEVRSQKYFALSENWMLRILGTISLETNLFYSGVAIYLPLALETKAPVGDLDQSDIPSADGDDVFGGMGQRIPVHIAVSADKMKATITTDYIVQHGVQKLVKESVSHTLQNLKITEDAFDLEKFCNQLKPGANIKGMVIAEGKLPLAPKYPFLFKTYQEISEKFSPDATVDIREMQQTSLVKEGEIVCEVRYKTPGTHGYNVLGAKLEMPRCDEDIEIQHDEYFKLKENKLIALRSGKPIINDENHVSLQVGLIHEGDVNLTTGNIYYDGHVEIKGSIDAGVTVWVRGDLMVDGEIGEAFVYASGNIQAKNGINTGKQGWIRCNGNLNAEFIEFSRLFVMGDIFVQKLLLNSFAHCKGSVHLKKDGIFAGGNHMVGGDIATGKMGLSSGAATHLEIGVDWTIKRKIKLRNARLENLRKGQKDLKMTLKEVQRKASHQHLKNDPTSAEDIEAKLKRIPKIIETLEKQLETLEEKLTYNYKSVIRVHDALSRNCKIEAFGYPLKQKQDLAEVMVQKKRDSQRLEIIALEQKVENKPEDEDFDIEAGSTEAA